MDGLTTIHGLEPGKTVAIFAGVHGNEQGGIPALHKAISSITLERGTVHYIIGNPKALEKNVRFTEMNLNRAFIRGPLKNPDLETTYERMRAKELMSVLDTCDALLDIHSVRNKQATPFIICEPEYFYLGKKLPFPIISNGWNTIEPGGTDYYMNSCGKPGICIECGHHSDPLVQERAFAGIQIFLQLMGNISGEPLKNTPNQQVISVTSVHITVKSFRLARTFYDFEPVTKNELLGYDGNSEFRAPDNGIVVFARDASGPGEEAIVFGKLSQNLT